ncbi:hypothetical protein M7784_13535 [Desulfovibrio aminophilus]|nr:hypothetical protein [Desulfovibrio aminophilus]MCM0756255.1 hypothetical protein [Desulfovibrio aminophilus]
MARALVLAFLILLSATPASASAADFDSDQAFMDWVTGYGPHPDPDRLAGAISYFAGSDLFRMPQLRRPLAYFFGTALFRATARQRDNALAAIEADPNPTSRVIFLNAVWYAGTPDSRALLNRLRPTWTAPHLAALLQGMLAEGPRPLLAATAPQDEDELQQAAQDLDCLWMRYLASDDPASVAPIIRTACLSVSAQDEGAKLLGFSARWSLRSNLKVPRVRALLEQRFAAAKDDEWIVLDDVLHGRQADPTPAK